MKQWIPVLAALLVALAASASDKTDALRKLRDQWSTQRFYTAETRSGAELAGLLDNNGSFANLRELETEFKKNNYGRKKFDQWELQQKVLNRLLVPAFEQLKRNSGDLADGKIPEAGRAEVKRRLYKGVLNYAKMEFSRDGMQNGRFHGSCFAMPVSYTHLTLPTT